MSSAATSSSSNEVEKDSSSNSEVEIKKKTPSLDELSKELQPDFDKEQEEKKRKSEEYIAETSKMFEKIEKYIEMLSPSSTASTSGGDLETVAEGLAAIRRMLLHPTQNPRSELVRHNAVEKLVHCLDVSDAAVQHNAVWCLATISSNGKSNNQLTEHGAVPRFIKLLESPTEPVREKSAWCLGNMAKIGHASVRDQILKAGVMQPLLNCLNSENKNIATLRNATWCLAQVLRYKPPPDFELVEVCLPTVRRLFEHPVTEIQENACWCVSYISDGEGEGGATRIQAVMSSDASIVPLVLDLLKSQRETFLLPSVRTFGNFGVAGPEMTQKVIDLGVLNHLAPLLQPNMSREVRKEVCFLISNVCASDSATQLTAVIAAGLMPLVVNNLSAPEIEVRREAAWVMKNATATSIDHVERMRYLVEGCGDTLGGLFSALATRDSKICDPALSAISSILLVGNKLRDINRNRNPYVDYIKNNVSGGKENLARLRDHSEHDVRLKSSQLMDRYFQDENDDDNDDGNNNKKKKSQKKTKSDKQASSSAAAAQSSESWTHAVD